MSLRSDREQADYEARMFGPPFRDQWNRSPVLDAITEFARAVGETKAVRVQARELVG